MLRKKLISMIMVSIVTLSSIGSSVFAKNFTSKQNVALNHAWTVNFNQKVNINGAFEGVYIEDNNGSKIETRINFSDDHTKMIVTPTDGYKPNTTYTLNVGGVYNEQGKALSDKAAMQFTTANAAQAGSFDITSVTANKDQGTATTNLDPDSSFGITFTKNVDASTLGNVTVIDKDGNKANVNVNVVGNNISISANNDFQDDTKTITVPRNAFKCNTTYTINLNGVKSSDGQDIATKTYSFTTRDYKLNPTISGICDDDYFKFASQYDSDMFHVTDPATNYTSEALWAAHDENGTIVFDKDKEMGTPYQVSNAWNKYANKQTRNQYDLMVQFRKQYNQIKAKDSSYNGKMVVLANWANIINDASFGIYDGWNKNMDTAMISTDIYSSYSLSSRSLDTVDLESSHPEDMKNILRSDAHPQIYIALSHYQGADLSLQKLYLYQELVSVFGYDYAGEISDYMYKEAYGLNSERNVMQKAEIGNITIWAEDGQFLFKY